MKIIRASHTETITSHSLCFDREGEQHSGFAFDCDADGNVSEETSETAKFLQLMDGQYQGERYQAPYVETDERQLRHDAVGECFCGREVYLGGFTNTCECGAEYNQAGQQLAARECWGEETGEHWTEII